MGCWDLTFKYDLPSLTLKMTWTKIDISKFCHWLRLTIQHYDTMKAEFFGTVVNHLSLTSKFENDGPFCMIRYVEVSWNGGTPKNHPNFNRIFHCKPSILGYTPIYGNPYMSSTGILHRNHIWNHDIMWVIYTCRVNSSYAYASTFGITQFFPPRSAGGLWNVWSVWTLLTQRGALGDHRFYYVGMKQTIELSQPSFPVPATTS